MSLRVWKEEHSLRTSDLLYTCVLCSTEECEVRVEVVYSGVRCLRAYEDMDVCVNAFHRAD